MTAQHYNTPRVPAQYVLEIVLVLFLFMAAVTFVAQIDTLPTSSAPAPLTQVYSHPLFATIQAHGQFHAMDMNGEMPDIPDCSNLGFKECRWTVFEASLREADVVDVSLVADDGTTILNVQAMEMPAEYAGYVGTGVPPDIWVSSVKVIRVARMNGLGRLGIDALNVVLGKWAANNGVDRVYHAFVDQAGWGRTMMAHIAQEFAIVYNEAQTFIYEVMSF